MPPFRAYPVFTGALVVLALTTLTEGALVFERRQAVRRAEHELQQNRRTFRALSANAPSPAMAAQIAANLAEASDVLTKLRTQLQAGTRAAPLLLAPPPASRAEAFFDLTAFAERMSEHARLSEVGTSAGERFGFAEYAHSGPEPELIPAVFRQRLVVEHLLEELWRAHPEQLVSVRREPPRTGRVAAEMAEAAWETTGGRGADFLEIDPQLSARIAGLVDAGAFRLEFIGDTAALRELLNAVTACEWPLLVRAVEAEPVVRSQGELPDAVRGATAVPVRVSRRPMKFIVTLELIEGVAMDFQPGANHDS